MAQTRRILFVCTGNIVRSPLAENLLHHHASLRGLAGEYQADSAGTTDYHVGEPPDPRMLKEAGKHGLTYDGRARLISWDDFDRFDLILALDRENYADLMSSAESHPTYKDKIHMLREFDPQAEGDLDVPDPYYGGNKGFSHTYEIIDRAIQGLLDTLQESRP